LEERGNKKNANQGFHSVVKRTDEKGNGFLGCAQEPGRIPQSKIPGFCHHKVACPFSLLFVEVGKFKPSKETKEF
jgi:hypothetical protein